jgi:hypothetical protein
MPTTEITITKAAAEGRPREFWVEVLCKDLNERDQLVERFRREGREVKLHVGRIP